MDDPCTVPLAEASVLAEILTPHSIHRDRVLAELLLNDSPFEGG